MRVLTTHLNRYIHHDPSNRLKQRQMQTKNSTQRLSDGKSNSLIKSEEVFSLVFCSRKPQKNWETYTDITLLILKIRSESRLLYIWIWEHIYLLEQMPSTWFFKSFVQSFHSLKFRLVINDTWELKLSNIVCKGTKGKKIEAAFTN